MLWLRHESVYYRRNRYVINRKENSSGEQQALTFFSPTETKQRIVIEATKGTEVNDQSGQGLKEDRESTRQEISTRR